MNRKLSLAAAAVSMLTVASLGLGLSQTAYAAPVPVVGDANTAVIDTNLPVELDIHKYLGTPTALPHDGTAQNVALPPVGGVNFDVYKVYYDAAHTKPVDLTTNQGWTDAAAINGYTPSAANIAAGSFTIGTPGTTYYIAKDGTATTDSTGLAAYKPTGGIGLYLVNENLTTSGALISNGQPVTKSSVTPAAPFFVTLPMTQPNDLTSWMYTVNVYPKNQSDTITKKVADETTYTLGEQINYTLNSTISGITPLGYYAITDNNQYVNATGVTLSITGASTVALTGCDGSKGTGSGPCDYYYWLDTDAGAAGSQMKIAFTNAGLTKLQTAKAADPTAQVTTVITGTIVSVPANGQLPNSASVIPNSSWYATNGGTTPLTPPADTPPGTPVTPPNPTTPGIVSNEVKSYFGNIVVNKTLVNPGTGDTAVGTEFQVFYDPTPTTPCTADDVNSLSLATKSITTGNSVTFTDLRASNWADNASLTSSSAAGWIQYCLVESKAPKGYNLNAQPFTVTIDYATGTATAAPSAAQAVSDEKANLGNSLPLTGGQGIAALSVAGLVLIGGGFAYYTAASRRRRNESDVA